MNPTISRILVPVDFSPHSETALRYAAALASRLGASMELLHVVEDQVATLASSPSIDRTDLSDPRDSLLEDAARHLERYRTSNAGAGVPTLTAVRIGHPTATITEYARSAGIDLVVMGTHGQTGLASVLLGSVATRVVRYAPCPVLTLHAEVTGHAGVIDAADESRHVAPPVTLRSALGRLGTSRE